MGLEEFSVSDALELTGAGDPGRAAARETFEMPPGEAELIERVQRGDAQAYEQIVRAHAARMLAVAQRLLRNPEDARDAVQEAFLAAYRHADGFSRQCRIGTWLHRIVVNAALMKLRSRGRRPEESIEPLLPRFQEDGHMIAPATGWQESGEAAIDLAKRHALVHACIARLPESYRTVLLLRDIEEQDPDETAALLGITVNAVNIRLHRARQALRTLLDPHLRVGCAR